ncbi:MAG: hypothetical protein BRC44_10435 [Cyanobacteria bacterium QS_4_48_99]|nr:MAG: hypothetical protein BRC44_10435 [Cyanobacteria bacterium QS_4_48_99]
MRTAPAGCCSRSPYVGSPALSRSATHWLCRNPLCGFGKLGRLHQAGSLSGQVPGKLPDHVGTRQQPSLETILRLNPDLILKNYGADQSLYTRLSQIAPTLFFRDGSNNYQWQQGIRTIAQVTNREQRAQQVIKQHNQRIARARSELKSLTRGSEILLLAMSGLDRIEVFTGETFAGDLLRNLGFKLVTGALAKGWEKVEK